jgi:N-acetylneuraminate lyase
LSLRLQGLVAATHTPFHTDGSIHWEIIPRQALALQRQGVLGAFINGSTGEGVSLTTPERKKLAETWREIGPRHGLKVIVHVGHTSNVEAADLAAHAAAIGCDAVSAMAPFYFKPASPKQLFDWIKPVALACNPLPFYFYDIPSMTGVKLHLPTFARIAVDEIPNFNGFKYTSDDLIQLQELLAFDNHRLDILYGTDEALLAALALGVRGGVGSSYNFAAGLYLKIIKAFDSGDFATARELQLQSVRLIQTVASFRYLPAAKRLMSLLGCDCGSVRPPLESLSDGEMQSLLEKVLSLQIIDESIVKP